MQDQHLDRYPAKALLASLQKSTPVGMVLGKLTGYSIYKWEVNDI